MDKIKELFAAFRDFITSLFTPTGWRLFWDNNIVVLVYGAIVYILGAFGGAFIQFIKDAMK